VTSQPARLPFRGGRRLPPRAKLLGGAAEAVPRRRCAKIRITASRRPIRGPRRRGQDLDSPSILSLALFCKSLQTLTPAIFSAVAASHSRASWSGPG
jgi:hypothetical protein